MLYKLNSDHRNYRNRKKNFIYGFKTCGEPLKRNLYNFQKKIFKDCWLTSMAIRSEIKDTQEYSYSAKLEEIRKRLFTCSEQIY